MRNKKTKSGSQSMRLMGSIPFLIFLLTPFTLTATGGERKSMSGSGQTSLKEVFKDPTHLNKEEFTYVPFAGRKAEDVIIKGRVVNVDNEPMANVSVSVKGSARG